MSDVFTLAGLVAGGHDPDALLDRVANQQLDAIKEEVNRVGVDLIQQTEALEHMSKSLLSDVRQARALCAVESRLDSAHQSLRKLQEGCEAKEEELKKRQAHMQRLHVELKKAQLDAQSPSALEREFPKIATAIIRGMQNGHQ